MFRRTAFLPLLLLGSLALFAYAEQVNSNLVNKNVERSIDITTHIVRQNVTMEILNNGSSSASVVHFAVEADQADHLSLLDVFDSNGRFLDVQKGSTVEDKSKRYAVTTLWEHPFPLISLMILPAHISKYITYMGF